MTNREYVQGLIGKAVERINEGVSKTLTARLASETPPLDPRHLTDTRTRVSTLLEYALAYELNHLLIKGGEGRCASGVLWNVFPDLFIRDANRVPFIGLEIKALHTAAEEKSANLSTPLNVINKGVDLIVILVWAWHRDQECPHVVFPHIHSCGVFDAYLLAQIRDYSWLYKKEQQIKGIDIATPILTPKGRVGGDLFKVEENNIGKLMRIRLDPDLPETTPNLTALKAESAIYEQFKGRAIGLGLTETFREVCAVEYATEIVCEPLAQYPGQLIQIGKARLPDGRSIALYAGGKIDGLKKHLPSPEDSSACSVALWLSSKLNWVVWKRINGGWSRTAGGAKPEIAAEEIRAAIAHLDR